MRATQALSVGRYRHLRLTTKDVNKGFYKGNRTGAMGRHTKYGGYLIEYDRVRTYVVPPNIQDFAVCGTLCVCVCVCEREREKEREREREPCVL